MASVPIPTLACSLARMPRPAPPLRAEVQAGRPPAVRARERGGAGAGRGCGAAGAVQRGGPEGGAQRRRHLPQRLPATGTAAAAGVGDWGEPVEVVAGGGGRRWRCGWRGRQVVLVSGIGARLVWRARLVAPQPTHRQRVAVAVLRLQDGGSWTHGVDHFRVALASSVRRTPRDE